MFTLIYKVFVKSLLLLGQFWWTFVARLKLGCMGKIGKNFKAQGPVYLGALKGNLTIGDNVVFGPNVRLGVGEGATVQIGDNVSLNQSSVIIAVEKIVIESDCRIGEQCSIRDNDHRWYEMSLPIREQGYISKPVFIGRDCWLGRGVVINKGVHIGSKSIIGASAVVTKNVPAKQIWAGVPAKHISCRE